MPELPEVETVARRLAPHVEGRRIVQVNLVDVGRPLLDSPAVLEGCRIERVERIGKEVVLTLAPRSARAPRRYLGVHLRMTGRLIYADAPPTAGVPHLRGWLRLDRGVLVFQDPRRFGTWRLLEGAPPVAPGLDPVGRAFTPARLAALLAGSRTAIKPWLLRQDRLVGMGNIYASEALYLAGIAPTRTAGSLDETEVTRLHAAVRRVLQRAIRAGGTTFSDFRDPSGQRGNYGSKLAVYDREGAACPGCGAAILRIVQQQRSTFHCTHCQS